MIAKIREAIRWRWRRLYGTKLRPFLVTLGIVKHKPHLKQEAMFIESLDELGTKVRIKNLRIDHETPANYYNDQRYEVLFPKRYVSLVEEIQKEKAYKFHFKGLRTPEREWVMDFKEEGSLIEFTELGRKIEKSFFDHNYYSEMCQSQFILCPEGKFKWTYRFYEAILCRSIPVVNRASIENSKSGFKYYVIEDQPDYEYREDWVESNYQLFLERHTIFNAEN